MEFFEMLGRAKVIGWRDIYWQGCEGLKVRKAYGGSFRFLLFIRS